MSKTEPAYENNPFMIGINGIKLFFNDARPLAIYAIAASAAIVVALLMFIVAAFISGATMSEAEKVALAARGQAASKSLSNAGGGSTGTLTLEALAGMSDDEFAEATKGDRWQKLLR